MLQRRKNVLQSNLPLALAMTAVVYLLLERRLGFSCNDIVTTTESVISKTISPTSNELARDTAWCPFAVCNDSAICQPCRRRFLIIITTARSASTTLTWMLDTLPGVRMSGENNDELKVIQYMIDNIRQHRVFQRASRFRQRAWSHNPVPTGAYACVAQHMIETINPPAISSTSGTLLEDDDGNTIVGFKTIRFLNNVKEGEEEELVRFVNEAFPCARILINIRSDVQAQAASQMASLEKSERKDADSLRDLNVRMLTVARMFGDRARVLDSNDWLKDIDQLNQVVEWLGFHKSCFFDTLLELNTHGFGAGRTEVNISPVCHYVGE